MILTLAGQRIAARRSLISEVNREIGSELAEVQTEIYKTYRRRLFPARWAPRATAFTASGLTVDSRLSREDQKAEMLRELRKIKQKFKPAPNPPTPKPGPAPEPTPATTVWFRTEDDNLFHAESHTGIEPAEFYAVRSDAVNAGLVADGVCGA